MLTGLKVPAEIVRIYAHQQSCLLKRAYLGGNGKIATVNESKAVYLAVFLGAVMGAERHEVVVFVAGAAALAVNSLKTEAQRRALNIAFSRPDTVKGYHVIILAVKLKTKAENAL